VAGSVVVELEAVEKLAPVHEAQLLAYLELKQLPLGLLINFNVAALRSGVIRIAN
jgi:GxxExxY protein